MDELLAEKAILTSKARERLWLLADRIRAMRTEVQRMLHDFDGSLAIDSIVFLHEHLDRLLTAMAARIAELDRRLDAARRALENARA